MNEIYQVLGTMHSMRLSNSKLRLPLIIIYQERVQVTRFFVLYTYSKY